ECDHHGRDPPAILAQPHHANLNIRRRRHTTRPTPTTASRIHKPGSGPLSIPTERSLTPAGIGSGWLTSVEPPGVARTICSTAMNDVNLVNRLYLRPSSTPCLRFASPWKKSESSEILRRAHRYCSAEFLASAAVAAASSVLTKRPLPDTPDSVILPLGVP